MGEKTFSLKPFHADISSTMPYSPPEFNKLPEPVNTDKETLTKVPETKHRFIILTILLGTITIVALAVIAFLLISSNNSEEKETNTIPSASIPEISDFSILTDFTDPSKAIALFTVASTNTMGTVEYRLEDNITRVVGEGKVDTFDTKNEVPITLNDNTTQVKIFLRINDGTKTSPWVNKGEWDLNVASPSSTNKSTVNEAYFETDWATGVSSSVEALNEALEVAFNASPYDPENPASECYSGGYAEVASGEIISPVPDNFDGYNLYYLVQQSPGSNTYWLGFAWCV